MTSQLAAKRPILKSIDRDPHYQIRLHAAVHGKTPEQAVIEATPACASDHVMRQRSFLKQLCAEVQ